jgi:hypothetical protein
MTGRGESEHRDWNEKELRATIKFSDPHQPGVLCTPCTENKGTLHYKGVYHPAGRPCLS